MKEGHVGGEQLVLISGNVQPELGINGTTRHGEQREREREFRPANDGEDPDEEGAMQEGHGGENKGQRDKGTKGEGNLPVPSSLCPSVPPCLCPFVHYFFL